MNKPIPPSMSMLASSSEWHGARDRYLKKLEKYAADLEKRFEIKSDANEIRKKRLARNDKYIDSMESENEALRAGNERLAKQARDAVRHGNCYFRFKAEDPEDVVRNMLRELILSPEQLTEG